MLDKLFSPSLDEKLKNCHPDDLFAELNAFINERLRYLDIVSLADCYAILNDQVHSKNINSLIAKAVAADDKNNHPLFFAYHALVVDNIYNLDPVKLEHSLKWLKTNIATNPHYFHVYNNLLAIHIVVSRTKGESLNLPQDSYVNLAKANLTDAKLTGMHLHHINLADANLAGADLSNSNLNFTNLKGANLDRAKLRGTCLQQVALDCSLRNADLTGADLSNGYLHKANLDLIGAKLCHVKMNAHTLFFGKAPQGTPVEFETYLYQKKNMLSQVEYFDASDFTDVTKMCETLTNMHEMLKDNPQFSFILNCITCDFTRKIAQIKIGNPELAAKLYDRAYSHDLFADSSMVTRVTNFASRSMFRLFYDDASSMPDCVETDCQEQMRMALGR